MTLISPCLCLTKVAGRLSPTRTYYFANMPLTFIPTIYHNVLRLLGISSTSKSRRCEIPLACVPIQVYCDRLQVQYNLEGSARMNECYVEEIKLYKVINGSSKHEYLVAKVRAPDEASFFLAFKRGRSETIDQVTHGEDDIDTPIQPQPGSPAISPGTLAPPPESASPSLNQLEILPPSSSETNTSSTSAPQRNSFLKMSSELSSSSAVASLNTLVREREADDKVTFLDAPGEHKGNHVLFRTLSFDVPSGLPPAPTLPSSPSPPSAPLPSSSSSIPSPIPSSLSSAPPLASSSSPSSPPLCLRLYELAVLVNTIHTAKPEYLLLSENCYFYAGTIIKVLQERYTPELKVETTGSEATDKRWTMLSWRGKGKGKELKAGDWHHLEIYAGEKVNTAPLIEKFEKDLADFKKPVRFLNVGSGQ